VSDDQGQINHEPNAIPSKSAYSVLTIDDKNALKRFNVLSYWTRTWICQELALSKVRTLWYGDSRAAWEDFNSCYDFLKWSHIYDIELDHYGSLFLIMESFSSPPCKLNVTYWQVLTTFLMKSACAYPQDKVYGVQNLLSEACRVKVDYTLSVTDVYFAAVHTWFVPCAGADGSSLDTGFVTGCIYLAIGMELTPKAREAGPLYQQSLRGLASQLVREWKKLDRTALYTSAAPEKISGTL
jgi:hypothetical protein